MINSRNTEEVITFSRDCTATMIPSGTKGKVIKGEHGIITQSLGGSYTVAVNGNLYRIEGEDADAIGKETVKKVKEKLLMDIRWMRRQFGMQCVLAMIRKFR
jgi:ATP-dependent protease HslVU (ClpYQ) peptidase subunit